MDEFIYSISVSVDMIGQKIGSENIKSQYLMRVEKYKIKSETKSNYVLYDRIQRVKKEEYEKIREGWLRNSSRNIGFIIWTKDKGKIRLYKEKMIQKINDTIDTYRNELKILEDAMNREIEVSFRDNNLDEYKEYEGRIAEDMFWLILVKI